MESKIRSGFIPNLVWAMMSAKKSQFFHPILDVAVLEGQGHITNPLGYVTALFDVFKKMVESS